MVANNAAFPKSWLKIHPSGLYIMRRLIEADLRFLTWCPALSPCCRHRQSCHSAMPEPVNCEMHNRLPYTGKCMYELLHTDMHAWVPKSSHYRQYFIQLKALPIPRTLTHGLLSFVHGFLFLLFLFLLLICKLLLFLLQAFLPLFLCFLLALLLSLATLFLLP